MAPLSDATLASGRLLERTITPAAGRLTRSMDTIDVPHKTIKRITCMGSGFVGGTEAFLGMAHSVKSWLTLDQVQRPQ